MGTRQLCHGNKILCRWKEIKYFFTCPLCAAVVKPPFCLIFLFSFALLLPPDPTCKCKCIYFRTNMHIWIGIVEKYGILVTKKIVMHT